jgi:sodium-dependent dicarboxylate transporter 2/3/5
MAAVQQNNIWKSSRFRFLIGIVIFLAIYFFVPEGNGLGPLGPTTLAIFVTTIWFWITLNTTWSNLLFFAALIVFGVMSPGAVWQNSIGHFAPMMIIVFYIIGQCLVHTGAIDRVAAWFITRKFVRGRPYAFLAMFFLSNLFIGMFMQNLALAILYLDLAVRVCEKIGVKKGDALYTAIIVGVMWGNAVISVASPIAKTLPVVMIGLADTALGIQITFAQWFMVGIPFTIGMFGIIMLCTRIFNPDVSPLKNLDVSEFEKNLPPMGKDGKIALFTMAALILAIMLPDIFVILGWFESAARTIVGWSALVPAIAALIFLCLIKAKNADGEKKPVMNFDQCVKGVPIGMVLFIGAVVLFGIPLGAGRAEDIGITVWLGNVLQPLVAGLAPMGIFIVLTVICVLITQLFSNMVVMNLFFAIGLALLGSTAAGMELMGSYGILIAFAATMAVLTPAASLATPVFYGPDHVTVANTWKVNIAWIVLTLGLLLIFIPIAGWVAPVPVVG